MRYMFVLLAFISSLTVEAQPSKKEQKAKAIKGMIDAKRFAFFVQSTTTSGGGTRPLSGSYQLTVLPDSIISELPYYGRMYQAPINSQNTGINFTSSKFEYTTKDHKKGGWDIKVKTQDVSNSPQFFLTVYPNGSGSLRITCSDRESISYIGFLQETGKNNKAN